MKLNAVVYIKRVSKDDYSKIVEECRQTFSPHKIRWFPYGTIKGYDIFHFEDKEDASIFIMKYGGTTELPNKLHKIITKIAGTT